ncbi:MAG: hypothetical protein JXA92_04935 [candidate division Zixibacteria bacterium]|nr:hypothetical protein [candidate division Zixibacteria bacterium]
MAFILISLSILAAGCSKKEIRVTELKYFPLDNLEGVLARDNIELDPAVTADGRGSLRINSSRNTVVRLFETGNIDIEEACLVYKARIRTENFVGRAYLEMWCQFDDRGEFFSRDLYSPLTGNADWSSEETVFNLKKGENPDNVKLNLVIEGTGTVWIDDIHLLERTV